MVCSVGGKIVCSVGRRNMVCSVGGGYVVWCGRLEHGVVWEGGYVFVERGCRVHVCGV